MKKIITLMITLVLCASLCACGYGYMSPYYASNGLPYRYDANNQTLIEIDGGEFSG